LKKNDKFWNWSRATVVNTKPEDISLWFHGDDPDCDLVEKQKMGYEIEPLGNRSKSDFEWRNGLKVGDKIDYYTMLLDWKEYEITQIFVNKEGEDMPSLGLTKGERTYRTVELKLVKDEKIGPLEYTRDENV